MTILSLDTAISTALKAGYYLSRDFSLSHDSYSQNHPLPSRINIRKRSSVSGFPKVKLPVTASFLSGIFDDTTEANLVQEQPSKKSRVSQPESTACSISFSCKTFVGTPDGPTKASDPLSFSKTHNHGASPVGANTSYFVEPASVFQFDRNTASPYSVVDDSSGNAETKLAFPHLPATVTDSSCDKPLTRVISDLQPSVSENSEKVESYGWFVDMEDEQSDKNIDQASMLAPFATSSLTQGLAFQAPTAPKADNHDAEVEWAMAADTVDDVLGDFF